MSEILDPKNLIDAINNSSKKHVMLDIGCGPNKKNDGYIGIDMLNIDNVDIVGQVLIVLSKISTDSVDEIFTSHFLEHIDNLEEYLKEFSRVLKPNGKLVIKVPHFSNPYYYSDPTHKIFFGLYTMSYFCDCNFLTREVPQYNHLINFDIVEINLNFSSTRPFYVRHAFKKLLGFIFASSYYMQEFWEENLSSVFPCYDIKFTLRNK